MDGEVRFSYVFIKEIEIQENLAFWGEKWTKRCNWFLQTWIFDVSIWVCD
jgi:hypothetical protein